MPKSKKPVTFTNSFKKPNPSQINNKIKTPALKQLIQNGGIKQNYKNPNSIIREYHNLNKRKAIIKSKLDSLPNKQNDTQIKVLILEQTEIDLKLDALGGLDAYQKSSLLGQSTKKGGDTSRYLIKHLFNINFLPSLNPIKLLDVGSLSPNNYEKEKKWIKTDCIDLNSQHPKISKLDFFDVPLSNPDNNSEISVHGPYDIVSLSLVVNFEGDIHKRGQMLIHAAKLLIEKPGILFLVLPLPCITNSRYFNEQRLLDIACAVGFEELLSSHHSTKLAYYIFRLSNKQKHVSHPQFKKTLLKDGPGKNNFCIAL
ncbi:hypothetical protein BB559_004652 [Furculomyces boomerangus]|uniref:25S rRNA adenine-N(1) methyltransferase n=1 Tax=Furculomyces boomerangus TaxID=61424 RepID=A0A2T9YDH2_9FUNG|nr:hypothetical protein BB559_004652 [Furculomyces boomerangus]